MSSWWTTKNLIESGCHLSNILTLKTIIGLLRKIRQNICGHKPILPDIFFANVHSTQRCESMNVALAIVLNSEKTYKFFSCY
ncbi:hypothetical protein GQ457_06G008990 [Hibiscus cannabinus]